MNFVTPEWFSAFALVVFLGVLLGFARRQRRQELRRLLPSHTWGRVGALWRGPRPASLRSVFLLTTAAALLAFALLRPSWGYRLETYETSASEIVLALDTSQSMMATDVQPTRLERARRKVSDLLERAAGDRIALVAYAGTAFLQTPLTEDARALRLFLDEIDTALIPVPGSRVDMALHTSLQALGDDAGEPRSAASSAGSQAIILLTDGEGVSAEAIRLAAEANKKGVKVFVLGIGSEEGAPVPAREGSGFQRDASGQIVLSRMNPKALAEVAQAGGGHFVSSVSGDADLRALYDEGVRKSLGTGQTGLQRKRLPVEVFQWPLFGALLLLALEAILAWCRPAPGMRSSLASAPGKKVTLLLGMALSAACIWGEEAQAWDFFNRKDRAAREAFEAGDYDAAVQNWRERMAEEGENASAADAYNLGSALYRQGKHAEAAQAFQQALQEYAREGGGDSPLSSETSNQAADAAHNLGNSHFLGGQLKEAVEAYEEALRYRPEDPSTTANLQQARALLEQQQKQQQSGGESSDQKQAENQKQQEGQQDQQGQPGQEAVQSQPPAQTDSETSESGEQQQQDEESSQEGDGRVLSPEELAQMDEEGENSSSGETEDKEKQNEESSASASSEAESSSAQTEESSASEETTQGSLSNLEVNRLLDQLKERPRGYLQYKARQEAKRQLEKFGAPEGGNDW